VRGLVGVISMKSRELLRALLVREIEAIKESDDLNPVSEEELNLEEGVIPKSDLKPYPDDLSPKPGDPDQDERTLGPVDIHRTHIIAPTKKSMDRYDSAVFSYRVAILR
jgi:hypothetical protein